MFSFTVGSKDWQRARQPEQKERRKTAILEAAGAVFERGGLEAATLSAIAREAGISKANVYRYFESREAIYLHLLQEDYDRWVSAAEAALAPLAGSDDAEAVAADLAGTMGASERLSALASVAPRVLEQNVSEERVLEFKLGVLPLAVRLMNALHAALPALTMEGAREALVYLYAARSGMWPMAHPSDVTARVIERPELAPLRVDWPADMERMMAVILRGLLAKHRS